MKEFNMTPHEVIKDSLEKFDEKFCSFNLSGDERCEKCLHKSFDGSPVADYCGSVDEYIKDYLKSSQLSLLLSVKGMCEQYKNYYNPMGDERNKGKHEAMSDLQSLLDEEINKVKEL